MTTLIWSRSEFKQFMNSMPELENDEVYFMFVQARRKYVEDSERTFGHDPILSRQIIRSHHGIEKMIEKLEKLERDALYASKTLDIPKNAFAFYFVLNKKSMIKAYYNFQEMVNKELSTLMKNYKRGTTPNYRTLSKLEAEYMSILHKKESSVKNMLKIIDIDSSHTYYLKKLENLMGDNLKNIAKFVIKTQNGYHVVLEMGDWKGKFLHVILPKSKLYLNSLDSDNKRIFEIKAENAQTAIPGTIQNGKHVAFSVKQFY